MSNIKKNLKAEILPLKEEKKENKNDKKETEEYNDYIKELLKVIDRIDKHNEPNSNSALRRSKNKLFIEKSNNNHESEQFQSNNI